MGKVIFTKDHKLIIEKLKQARNDAKLSQYQVAKKMDRTQSYVSKIESGQRRVDVIQLKEFAKIYKKDIGYFLN